MFVWITLKVFSNRFIGSILWFSIFLFICLESSNKPFIRWLILFYLNPTWKMSCCFICFFLTLYCTLWNRFPFLSIITFIEFSIYNCTTWTIKLYCCSSFKECFFLHSSFVNSFVTLTTLWFSYSLINKVGIFFI